MMTPPTEMLFGTCRQLLFSRDGAIEGCLITVKGKTAQVSMTSEEGSLLSQMIGPGKRMRILATPDLSADAIDAPHPVFCFVALADSQGEPLDMPDIEPGASAISGQVSMLTYAQHGQPNGVVLDTGEFITLVRTRCGRRHFAPARKCAPLASCAARCWDHACSTHDSSTAFRPPNYFFERPSILSSICSTTFPTALRALPDA